MAFSTFEQAHETFSASCSLPHFGYTQDHTSPNSHDEVVLLIVQRIDRHDPSYPFWNMAMSWWKWLYMVSYFLLDLLTNRRMITMLPRLSGSSSPDSSLHRDTCNLSLWSVFSKLNRLPSAGGLPIRFSTRWHSRIRLLWVPTGFLGLTSMEKSIEVYILLFIKQTLKLTS